MFDWTAFLHNLSALAVAAVLGGVLGFEREVHGRWAGLRTHILVALGASMFVVAGMSIAPGDSANLSRIIQGLAAGVGFIGAGTIVKLTSKLEVKGLTTASSIWLAAAVGTAAGVRLFDVALACTLIALVVLTVLRRLEKELPHAAKSKS